MGLADPAPATSLATIFEVIRCDGAAREPDWSLAETVDLAAHTRSDEGPLDEIARVLQAPEWDGRTTFPTSPSLSD